MTLQIFPHIQIHRLSGANCTAQCWLSGVNDTVESWLRYTEPNWYKTYADTELITYRTYLILKLSDTGLIRSHTKLTVRVKHWTKGILYLTLSLHIIFSYYLNASSFSQQGGGHWGAPDAYSYIERPSSSISPLWPPTYTPAAARFVTTRAGRGKRAEYDWADLSLYENITGC